MRKMIVLGHRGYSAKYPENTLLAFREAIKAGADGIELDVWQTRDGKVLVHHDANFMRTAGLSKSVKNTISEDIKKYSFRGEKFTYLEDVYEHLPSNTFINVEIKDIDVVENAFRIVKEHGALHRTLFSSFNIYALKKLRNISPDARIGILFESRRIAILIPVLVPILKAEFVNAPIIAREMLGLNVFRFLLKSYKLAGAKIALWTVNSKDSLTGIEDLCDVVITDDVSIWR